VAAAPKTPFFFPDALTNPAYRHFAIKTTAAALICYLIYTGLDWQDIHTAMVTCYVATLGTTGETVHKLALRITGCLIGAVLGMGSLLFVMPQLETVGGLMVLVFAGVLVAAWVSTGPERIAYGGVQIALAFLLTVLQGFGPATSLDTAWNRIVGILLGNVVVYLIFTHIWPVSIESAARAHLQAALAAVRRLAARPPAARLQAVPDAALVGSEIGKVAELLKLIPAEPRAIRPTPASEAALREAAGAIGSLAREVWLARTDDAASQARLARLERMVAG
jgi:multidrug resistance protein MdtO